MGARALKQRFLSLQGRLPMASLGSFPTPVVSASKLGDSLGVETWIKRDDQSGLEYGGNKVRKLELLLGKAVAEGHKGIVTTGAYGSHHVLATCTYARVLGLEATAVLCPQPVTEHVRETLLATHQTGATLVPVASCVAAGPRMVTESLRRRAMLIGPGGSSPLGALAYAGAALELAEQVARGQCPSPSRIYVALGSSGSMAGLLLGVWLSGLPTKVVGVRVTPRVAANELTVAALATRASLLLRRLAPEAPFRPFSPFEVLVDHSQIGAGYGEPTGSGEEARTLCAALDGPELDPTYTAKAMAALIRDARSGVDDPGPWMFVSTLSSADLSARLSGATTRGMPRELAELFESA